MEKMEDSYEPDKPNGGSTVTEDDGYTPTTKHTRFDGGGKSLDDVVTDLVSSILSPDPHSSLAASSLLHRTKVSLKENLPRLPEASRSTGLRILRWARRGSPLRLLLVISVGTITLLTLTGLLVFMLFLVAATVNAIVLSLIMSLVAAGGFLAIFFACVAAIYIGTLSVAVFVISSAAISAIIAVAIAAGWIGFLWTVWFTIRKSAGFAKHSIHVTGSTLSAYTASWQAHRQHHD